MSRVGHSLNIKSSIDACKNIIKTSSIRIFKKCYDAVMTSIEFTDDLIVKVIKLSKISKGYSV